MVARAGPAHIIGSSPLAAAFTSVHPDVNERILIRALEQIRQQQFGQARATLEGLLADTPKFKLAQMVYGDLLMAMASPLKKVGQGNILPEQTRRALVDEMQQRWHHYIRDEQDIIPAYLLELDGTHRYVIVVDVAASRLYLYKNEGEQLALIKDFYASVGLKGAHKLRQGDQKTPLGVYFVNEYLSPDELPDLYGAGAFPIDYPNEWDRRQGKTGYGIWLHGTPSYTFSRPPRASDGCVTLSNQDFITLSSFIEVGRTPVIIADGVEWLKPDVVAQRRLQARSMLEQWKKDWESLDIDRYLQHYSKDFTSDDRDYKAWAENARLAYSDARDVHINLRNLSIFAYPEENLVIATFVQEYNSDNIHLQKQKKQYWRKEGGSWKIVYEGSV